MIKLKSYRHRVPIPTLLHHRIGCDRSVRRAGLSLAEDHIEIGFEALDQSRADPHLPAFLSGPKDVAHNLLFNKIVRYILM